MPLVGAVAIVALAMVLFAIVPFTQWLVDSDLSYVNGDNSADEVLRAVDRTRGRIFQVAAGAAALVALTFTGLTYRLSIKSQVIDRYTKSGRRSSEASLGPPTRSATSWSAARCKHAFPLLPATARWADWTLPAGNLRRRRLR